MSSSYCRDGTLIEFDDWSAESLDDEVMSNRSSSVAGASRRWTGMRAMGIGNFSASQRQRLDRAMVVVATRDWMH